MSDPLNSVVFINDTYNEYSNGNSSKYKRQDENFEAEDTEDESTDDNYIKVKINVSSIYSYNKTTFLTFYMHCFRKPRLWGESTHSKSRIKF